eukprot:15448765-Alexandrium_andersonii.AAC.1
MWVDVATQSRRNRTSHAKRNRPRSKTAVAQTLRCAEGVAANSPGGEHLSHGRLQPRQRVWQLLQRPCERTQRTPGRRIP